MATITLANLRTRARDRANMENSLFVTDSIFNSYINYAVSDLREKITSKVGEDYFASSSSSALTPGQETLNLPSDFFKLLWVEVLGEDGNYYPLRRFEIAEKPVLSYGISHPGTEIKYRLRADTLWLQPANATGGRTVRLWYVPMPATLALDSDTLNGYNGWDEYVVLLAARKALVKEEQDVSDIDRELVVFNERLESMIPNRDQARPMRIQDTSGAVGSPWR